MSIDENLRKYMADGSSTLKSRGDSALGFFTSAVDWKLLSEQKNYLLRELEEVRADGLEESAGFLQGVINFIDAFQDCAADELRIPGMEFLTEEESGVEDSNAD